MINLCIPLRKFLILVIALLYSGTILNAGNGGEKSIFDQLNFQETVTINLEGDITFLKENKRNQEEHDAILSYEDESGQLIKWDVGLSIRGKYRRMFSKGIPPLKLNFKKKDLKQNGLAAFDDLKLVTLFHEDKREAYQTLVKEFLTYKIYNTLTEDSYRVQLVKINFKDTTTGKTFKEHGFLIEDFAQLIDRIGAEKIEDPNSIAVEDFNDTQMEFVCLFQYMIGNADWGLANKKNIELCLKNDKVIAIPFDFDFCGLVDASYAVPNNSLNLRSVKQRKYFGTQDSLHNLNHIYQKFEDKKEEILRITDKCKLMSRKNRKKATAYLESFFEDIKVRKELNLTMSANIEELEEAK